MNLVVVVATSMVSDASCREAVSGCFAPDVAAVPVAAAFVAVFADVSIQKTGGGAAPSMKRTPAHRMHDRKIVAAFARPFVAMFILRPLFVSLLGKRVTP